MRMKKGTRVQKRPTFLLDVAKSALFPKTGISKLYLTLEREKIKSVFTSRVMNQRA